MEIYLSSPTPYGFTLLSFRTPWLQTLKLLTVIVYKKHSIFKFKLSGDLY